MSTATDIVIKRQARKVNAASIQPAPALDAPQIELTPAEKHLLNSFRLMDNRGREFIEKVALSQARMWPRHTGPSLRLIVGGAV